MASDEYLDAGGGTKAAAVAAGFAVGTLANAVVGKFQKVEGLGAELKVESYEEGGLNTDVHTFALRANSGTLTLKRGVTALGTDLWDWYYQVVNGSSRVPRKSGLILLTDYALGDGAGPLPFLPGGGVPVAAWFFRGALPTKLSGPTFDAASREIAVESLELKHSGLTRVGLSMIPGVGSALAKVGL
jgi:phage tail-like protein